MDGAGDKFLSGAALSGDQDGASEGRDAPDLFKDLSHRGRAGEHALKAIGAEGGRAEGVDLELEPAALLDLAEGEEELGSSEGFGDVVMGACSDGLHGAIEVGVGAHHDNACIARERSQRA